MRFQTHKKIDGKIYEFVISLICYENILKRINLLKQGNIITNYRILKITHKNYTLPFYRLYIIRRE